MVGTLDTLSNFVEAVDYVQVFFVHTMWCRITSINSIPTVKGTSFSEVATGRRFLLVPRKTCK